MINTMTTPQHRLAATLMLLRDSPQGLEVFMVARHHKIDSFAGALVFPGGKVEVSDQHETLRCYCRNDDAFNDHELAFRVAAIRETFEECGVLLAYQTGSNDFITADDLALLQPLRQQLNDNNLDMLKFCHQTKLELAIDQLVHFAHWITPKMRPKIFDTHFFLAATPPDQIAEHDGHESLDSIWIRPADAINRGEQGTANVVFPTRMNLSKLDRSPTLEQALATAHTEAIVTVQPEPQPCDGGNVMTIPAAAGYGGSRIFFSSDGRELRIVHQ